ncbi:MAG: zinc ABC transporter substrate-binding protein [Desulfuromonadales bacterium]
MRKILAIVPMVLLSVLIFSPLSDAAASPRVVASILPVQSLVSGVMAGVGSPELIVKGGGSPHSYSLRPSEARALARSQVIVWVGPNLESFLAKSLATLGARAKVVTLAEAPGVRLLPARHGGVWEPDADEPKTEPGHEHGTWDPHIWLDPQNARAIVAAAVAALSEADPAHGALYRKNGEELEKRLDALKVGLEKELAPVRGKPFIVFHDAYQYFDRRFGLNAVGSITVGPEQEPGVRRLREIRAKILASGARCVFSEPQFEPKMVGILLEGTKARAGVLDPLGADLPPGPEAYFTLMRRLADNLKGCLGGGK